MIMFHLFFLLFPCVSSRISYRDKTGFSCLSSYRDYWQTDRLSYGDEINHSLSCHSINAILTDFISRYLTVFTIKSKISTGQNSTIKWIKSNPQRGFPLTHGQKIIQSRSESFKSKLENLHLSQKSLQMGNGKIHLIFAHHHISDWCLQKGVCPGFWLTGPAVSKRSRGSPSDHQPTIRPISFPPWRKLWGLKVPFSNS